MQRQIVNELRRKFGFKLTELLLLVSLAKSTYHYCPHRHQTGLSNLQLLRAIIKIKQRNCGYGYWRATDLLHRQGIKVNHKRVYRLIWQNHLSGKIYNLRAGKYDSSKGHKERKPKIVYIGNLRRIVHFKKLLPLSVNFVMAR